VEVVFPSNAQGEIDEKIALYLSKGAHEVWIVSEGGKSFTQSHYNHGGQQGFAVRLP